MAQLSSDGRTIFAGGVAFSFHRTLRVPDAGNANKLPPVRLSACFVHDRHTQGFPQSFGKFYLEPVSRYAHRLPATIVAKGGFITVNDS